jgi:molybdopterin-binding protein
LLSEGIKGPFNREREVTTSSSTPVAILWAAAAIRRQSRSSQVFSPAGTAYTRTAKSSYQGFFKEQNVKLSARNQLKGKIVEVTKGATTSHVRVDVGHGTTITASITNEAVAELGLTKGDDAWAVIKASDVMIGK